MLIGLVGYAGAGKDEVGKFLLGEKDWRRAAFADALKQDIARLVEKPVEEVNKHKNVYRPLLVFFGNWARANLHSDWWIQRMVSDSLGYAEWAERGDLNLVVTDVRYVNEAEWIKECGGFLLAVVRPDVAAACVEEQDSVRAITDAGIIDGCVRNIGTLDFLRVEVQGVVRELVERGKTEEHGRTRTSGGRLNEQEKTAGQKTAGQKTAGQKTAGQKAGSTGAGI